MQIGLQLFDAERSAANGGMNDAGLVGAILHLTRLGVLDGGGDVGGDRANLRVGHKRSEEHTSELQSLMRISYAVFCLKKKKTNIHPIKRKSTLNPPPQHTP